jgi:hypothetical protein
MKYAKWKLILKLLGVAVVALLESACTPTVPTPATPTPAVVLSPTPTQLQIEVFFTDSYRYAAGTEPFEEGVTRVVSNHGNAPEAVLHAFFAGPTEEEKARGLEAITSGFTGLRALDIQDDIARVYLAGPCASNGATYTIAQPLMRNLLQFEEIKYVKIYDSEDTTEEPEGPSNSIPFCLEP